VTTNPTKVIYYEGDDFESAGIVVTATYSNGTTRVLAANEYTITAPDMDVAGQVDVVVTAGDKTTSFKITIVSVNVISIFVAKAPDKVEYERNEELDLTGLEVNALLSNAEVIDVTDQVVASEVDMTTAGTKTLTLTYGNKTVNITITVKVPTPLEVVIKSFPTKTYYNIGEAPSKEGLEVAYKMSDGTFEDIPSSGYVVNGFTTDTPGQKEVTIVAGGGKSVKFNIYVAGPVTYTYNDYTTVSPSNWNELTYQDNNDTQIMNYISGSFFSFDFEFDSENKIVPGGYKVDYNAVTTLEDVTADFAGEADYAVPAAATKGYAYKFTLRNDLKWDDGTAIKAEDFVYTMQEQLNPLFYNYRADSFYNSSTVIHNAKNYLYQGSEGYFSGRSFADVYDPADDASLFFRSFPLSAYTDGDAWSAGESNEVISWFLSNNPSWADNVKNYGFFIILYAYGATDMSPAECRAASLALDKKSLAEIKADPTLNAYWEEALGFWKTLPNEELDLVVAYVLNPPVDFADVGIFVGDNDYELVIVLDKVLNLFKEDGQTLSYQAAYNFNSLPLVKRDLYEANKVPPQLEGGLWTSKYNSSVATSASWGPYKLTYFQAGKQYICERNPNWYGYNMPMYEGQYTTDRIVCDTISQWNTAWLAFQKGDLASIGIDVSIADDYKRSQRAVFTASDFVGSLQLQSDAEALEDRSSSTKNKMLMTYKDFRQAISLGIDRLEFTQRCTTSSLPGYGLFNSMHYYDVENAGVYRDTIYAKEALLAAYGVDVEEFESLDKAYESITGYNIDLAKDKLTAAYNEALAAGDITATDKVVFTVGAAADNESSQRVFNFLKEAFEELAVGTPLEGRLTLEFDARFGDQWANSFRNGEYDICTGGWTGAAWDPGYFLLAYLSPDYMYSTAWETDKELLTFNPYDDGDENHEYTMALLDWYDCLNGIEGAKYNWAIGEVDNDVRLRIIAKLEQAILEAYYTVPLYNSFTAQLLSYKVDFITTDYNTFMAYGGLRYLKYNYTDAEWAAVKDSFDYKN